MKTSSEYRPVVEQLSQPGKRPEDAGELRHHVKDGVGFINPWDSHHELAPVTIMRTMAWNKLTGKAPQVATSPAVPVQKPELLASRETKELRTTWLGHACHLVDFPGGLKVLFDPVFTERCSPFTWLGPKRITPMPCQIADIPIIDVVVISHNHYDHMSHPTMMSILQHHPNVHFFVPLGNKQWCIDSGIKNVTELDWWDERKITLDGPTHIEATIGSLPCQHTSARTAFDKAHTLWSSWSVESGGKKVWFGGDTGYRAVPQLPKGVDDYAQDFPHCPAFKQIGDLRGPFDLGLIPIGAYDPRWLFSPVHANPFDSVNIFLDTKCKKALGIHWGTWVLTEEDIMEPPKKLKEALKWKGIAEKGIFDVCDIGESRVFE